MDTSPGRAPLVAHERGEFEMILPTIRNLQAIAHFSSARDVLDLRPLTRTPIPCVEPQIVNRDGAIAILTPGDGGFTAEGSS